jgi:hypothetical protein
MPTSAPTTSSTHIAFTRHFKTLGITIMIQGLPTPVHGLQSTASRGSTIKYLPIGEGLKDLGCEGGVVGVLEL